MGGPVTLLRDRAREGAAGARQAREGEGAHHGDPSGMPHGDP